MKRYGILSALALGIAALGWAGGRPAASVPVLTDPKALAQHVGETVTLMGKVSNTKVPQILGVDVASDAPDLRGKRAQATGVLERYEVTPAQIEEWDRDRVAHRGPGVFYRLRDAERNTEAQVRARP